MLTYEEVFVMVLSTAQVIGGICMFVPLFFPAKTRVMWILVGLSGFAAILKLVLCPNYDLLAKMAAIAGLGLMILATTEIRTQ